MPLDQNPAQTEYSWISFSMNGLQVLMRKTRQDAAVTATEIHRELEPR